MRKGGIRVGSEFPRFVVHAGFPKCGSTTLQSALVRDSKRLFRNGVVVLGARDGARGYPFGADLHDHLFERGSVFESEKLEARLIGEFEQAWNEARSRHQATIVVSHENIEFRFERFVRLLPPEVKIDLVFVVRDLERWTQSLYIQKLKTLEDPFPGSFDDFVEKTIASGLGLFHERIRSVSNNNRIERVEVLEVASTGPSRLLEDFYSKVLRVDIHPVRIAPENQSLSIDQIVKVRSIRRIVGLASAPLKAPQKSVAARLVQIVCDDASEVPFRGRFLTKFRNDLELQSEVVRSAMNEVFGSDLQRALTSAGTEVDPAELVTVTSRGVRLMCRSAIQLLFEVTNKNEREWVPNFDIEGSIVRNPPIIKTSKSWYEVCHGVRQVDEILALLDRNGFEGRSGGEFKSVSKRLREVIWERIDPRLGFGSRPPAPAFRDDQVASSFVSFFVGCVFVVAWELVNEADRDWEPFFGESEFRFLGDPFCDLANIYR